ncbi:sel1 repeat family protein [Salmonella enterica]|nr:sel1 repeat family protein [Salmonella enterica]
MKLLVKYALLILTAICYGNGYGNIKIEITSPRSNYSLDDSSKKVLESKSMDGNPEASFRLYQYYAYANFDVNKQNEYLRITISQGGMAQYYYGIFLSNENKEYSKYYDLDKAIYWMEQATKYDIDAAVVKLKELRKRKVRDNYIKKTGMRTEIVSMSQTYYLSEYERAQLDDKSNSGDSESSFRLFLYYLFNCDYYYCYDIDHQELYLKKAAIQGGIKAQYNYGIFLSDKELKYYNLNKAIYWVDLAAKNGDVDAKNKLLELKN